MFLLFSCAIEVPEPSIDHSAAEESVAGLAGEFLVVHNMDSELLVTPTSTVYGMFSEVQDSDSSLLLCWVWNLCDVLDDQFVDISIQSVYDWDSFYAHDIGDVYINDVRLSTDSAVTSWGEVIYQPVYNLEIQANTSFVTTIVSNGEETESHSTDLLQTPPSWVFTSHNPNEAIVGTGFGNGLLPEESLIHLLWEPQGGQHVYFIVTQHHRRFAIRTENDGTLEIDLSSLALDEGNLTIEGLLIHLETDLVAKYPLSFIGVESIRFQTTLTKRNKRTDPVIVNDECTEEFATYATGMHLLGGEIDSSWTNKANKSCISEGDDIGQSAKGVDGFVSIHLEEGETIIADFEIGSADALLYITEQCGNTAACLDYSDQSGLKSERIIHQNTEESVDLILGLDIWEREELPTSLPQDYLLDLWIGNLETVSLFDTCEEAESTASRSTGTHQMQGLLTNAFENDIEGDLLPKTIGPDAFVSIVIPPNGSLSVKAKLDNHDVALYLLEGCERPDQIKQSVNFYSELDWENLTYTNQTQQELQVMLGVDVWLDEDDPSFQDDTYILSITVEE